MSASIRELRLLLAGMEDARAALEEGLTRAGAAFEAGRFEQAGRIAVGSCQAVQAAFTRVLEPAAAAPRPGRKRRKR